MGNSQSFEMDIQNNNISKIKKMITKDKIKLKKMITKNKININEPITEKGYNLLHIALQNCDTELIYFLLDQPNIDVNFVSNYGVTMLMSLIKGIKRLYDDDSDNVINLKKYHDCRYHKKDTEISKEDIIFNKNIITIAERIIQNYDRQLIISTDSHGLTTLDLTVSLRSAKNGEGNIISTKIHKKLIKLLLNNGADINRPTIDPSKVDDTNIHILELCNVMGGNCKILKYLIKNGANLWFILLDDFENMVNKFSRISSDEFNLIVNKGGNHNDSHSGSLDDDESDSSSDNSSDSSSRSGLPKCDFVFSYKGHKIRIKKHDDTTYIFWKFVLSRWLQRKGFQNDRGDQENLYNILLRATKKYDINEIIIKQLPQPIFEEIIPEVYDINYILAIAYEIIKSDEYIRPEVMRYFCGNYLDEL